MFTVLSTALFGYDKYRLQSIGLSRSAARRAVQIVIRGKIGLLRKTHQVLLPVQGQIAMQVHRGFKVFDFKQLQVAKVFDAAVSSESAQREVAASRQASEIKAAPRFIAEDPGLAWYREEYVCGLHATDKDFRGASGVLDFYADVEACLLELVACKPPINADTSTYLERYAGSTFQDRWLNAGHDPGTVEEIADYLQRLRDWLQDQATKDQLQLVLTHGDFSLVNAISTRAGLRFIDWEGIARGSLYSDVFNFLFVEQYYERASANFVREMTEFIDRYRETCRARFPELRVSAEMGFAYARRQYYFERVSLLLDRSESSNLSHVVRKSIAMFQNFDRDIGDDIV